ncbi:MAG: S49 family peptidase, partial [Bdellovibrionales bacterium]
NPSTLTGSIGVISGKFALDGMLKKIGVTTDGVSTDANAGMWNMMSGFTPAQRARVNALLDSTYRAFVNNVSVSRKIPLEKMPDVAKGRIFTGEQAAQAGLVDEVGGYDITLRTVRNILNLNDKAKINMKVFPAPPSPAERLLKWMRRFSAERAGITSAFATLIKMQSALSSLFGIEIHTDHAIAARMQPIGEIHD